MASYEQLEKAFANAKRVAEAGGQDAPRATEAAKNFARMLKNKEYDIDDSFLGREGELAAILQGIGQGATFGFADEIGAGLRTGIDKMLGDRRGWGDVYAGNLQSQRRALGAARRENPGIMLGSELATGLASGGAGMVKSVAGKAILPAFDRGAMTGAGMGALGGYGYTEKDPLAAYIREDDPQSIKNELYGAVGDTATGAIVGGVMGAVMPSVISGMRSAGRFALNVTPGVNKWFREGKLKEAGRKVVAQSFIDDVASGEISYDDALKTLKDVPGMTVADLSPALRATAETVMHSGTQAGTQMRKFVQERNRSAWSRFLPRLAGAMGREKDNFTQAKQAVLNKAKETADKHYKLAYAEDIEITPRMREILNAPAFRATEAAATRGRTARMMRQGVPAEKIPPVNLKEARYVPTEDADDIIRAMGAKVDNVFRSKDSAVRGTGGDYKALRKEFMEEVFKQNEDLRVARNTWSDNKSIDEAIEYGEKILRGDEQLVAEKLAGMTDGEKLGVRIGTLHAISKAVLNKADDADIIKGVFNSENKRRIIREAFGDEDAFRDFMGFVRKQQDMFETYRASLGSDTARRLSTAAHADEQIAKLTGYAFDLSFGGGIPLSIAGNLAGRGYANVKNALGYGPSSADKFMQYQADLLRSADIDQLLRPNLMGGLLSTGAPTEGARVTGGLLASGWPQQTNDVRYGGP